MLPSGSELADPLNVTSSAAPTVWLAPAFAVGATLTTGLTVMFTVDAVLLAPRLSVTTSEKVSVATAADTGAGNVGCTAEAFESDTVAPPVCDHA